MLIATAVFAVAAAALHVFIWYLESFAWTTARARAVFGTSASEAEATRELAYNQGFYNLFLAMIAVAGVVAAGLSHHGVGLALILAGTGAMLAAALVLAATSPDKLSAAAKQGAAPLVAVVLAIVAVLT
ncbi:DUF1304 domain-containing protein [Skermania sp. ID1734]|uniref:DUF1304 domain-containing protein n=1 Tax=Skermania sp. ID1734 TaxID=2597516 RepID=UPI001180D4DF|nr:DUF1304 domain-containing protein [Skermania sp. ID1734]TSD97258.1 DUF1304 domain-containing protein [Skermania sp. ID1734]